MDLQQAPKTAKQVQAFFSTPRPSRQQRHAEGEGLRAQVPLESMADLPSERGDALALLTSQEKDRLPDLIRLRHERMTTDPFAFLRGAALVMADDLSRTPNSGISVQLCGDAHVANFGMFASPERDLVFDLNDFDETLPGPFEWDVKRLAASLVVAGHANGHKPKQIRKAAREAVSKYRETMAQLATMRTLDVWYATVNFAELLKAVRQTSLGKAAEKAGKKAGRRTGDSAVAKLTEVVDGKRQFRPDPPLVVRVPDADRIALLMQFSYLDIAHKVVGVGSVGTRAIAVLLESGDKDPLILQFKQAGQSVLENYLTPSNFSESGKRVVVGQRVMQTVGDPFLGWCRSTGDHPFDFYGRQLRDMKGSIETVGLSPDALQVYARICGAVLARAHARGGDPSKITGYLGEEATFDEAVADFAMGYADLNERDYEALKATLA